MTFMVFERHVTEGTAAFRPTGGGFKLAGYQLLHQAWVGRGKPLNQGWHVSRDELLDLHFGVGEKRNDPHLIIDFHPSATGRIGLIEPMDIWAYTFGDETGKAVWTPLMLRLRDVFYKEYDEALTPEARAEIIGKTPVDFDGQESIEFLYLNGDDRGWNWGRNGMTNAAFLQGEARVYFRQFF